MTDAQINDKTVTICAHSNQCENAVSMVIQSCKIVNIRASSHFEGNDNY